MYIIAVVLSSLSIIFTGLPFIRSSAWWIRIFDFPRIQVAVLCLLSAALLYFFTDINNVYIILLLLLLTAAFVYQGQLIIRYTPFYKKQTHKSQNGEGFKFSMLQSNLKMDNREAEAFVELVKECEPDIFSVNEPDDWWAKQLAVFDEAYPHSIKLPANNTYGMMLFSKFPLKNAKINFLVKDDIPSFTATVALSADKEFDVYCLHPEPPSPGSPTYERDTELLLVGKQIKEKDRPAVVVGDLNDVAWSYTSRRFQRYGGIVDPRMGRGMYNTYNVNVPLFRYPLDHFFYTPHFRLVALKKLPDIGSDHFPMFIEVQL